MSAPARRPELRSTGYMRKGGAAATKAHNDRVVAAAKAVEPVGAPATPVGVRSDLGAADVGVDVRASARLAPRRPDEAARSLAALVGALFGSAAGGVLVEVFLR